MITFSLFVWYIDGEWVIVEDCEFVNTDVWFWFDETAVLLFGINVFVNGTDTTKLLCGEPTVFGDCVGGNITFAELFDCGRVSLDVISGEPADVIVNGDPVFGEDPECSIFIYNNKIIQLWLYFFKLYCRD